MSFCIDSRDLLSFVDIEPTAGTNSAIIPNEEPELECPLSPSVASSSVSAPSSVSSPDSATNTVLFRIDLFGFTGLLTFFTGFLNLTTFFFEDESSDSLLEYC